MSDNTNTEQNELEHLGKLLLAQRTERGMSLADVKVETGISTSTLSRSERGLARLDFKNLVILKRWLGVPLSTGTETATGTTLEKIRNTLNGDKTLDKAVADALYELMEHAYTQFANRPS